jgi:hypothetical protein
LRVHSNFYLPQMHPMIEEMVALRGDVFGRLNCEPGEEPIHVYLFRSPRELAAAAHSIADPIRQRRAFFLQTADSLNVFTSWSYDVAEDLRHELTHGYLHSICPEIPLWLDEGLAEYFEVPPAEQGVHWDHLRLLAQAASISQPPSAAAFDWRLSRLESLSDPAGLTQADYALSWLWVATLLSTPQGVDAVAAELQSRRAGEASGSLLGRLGQDEDQAVRLLQRHLQGLIDRHRHRL